MARRTSWLLRLPEIRRSVCESVRSHYERRDLERIFQIQPRAAQKLMRMVTVGVAIGRSALVDRQALSDFLTRVAESDNPETTLRVQRNVCAFVPRRALRELIQVDTDPATLETIPRNVTLSTGKMEIEFTRMEELAGALHAIAQILENEFEEFTDRFEPVPERVTEADPVAENLRQAFAELRRHEQEKAARCATNNTETKT